LCFTLTKFVNEVISQSEHMYCFCQLTKIIYKHIRKHFCHVPNGFTQTKLEHIHCLCHSRQMMLFRRILSFRFTLMPRKFFHLGDTIFPLENNKTASDYVSRKLRFMLWFMDLWNFISLPRIPRSRFIPESLVPWPICSIEYTKYSYRTKEAEQLYPLLSSSSLRQMAVIHLKCLKTLRSRQIIIRRGKGYMMHVNQAITCKRWLMLRITDLWIFSFPSISSYKWKIREHQWFTGTIG